MSKRAIYIPPAKRTQRQSQQPPRFHGAFTGGFSAGHFNTVGTREGWQPSTEPRRQQTLEDFMDEQDVHEWGGPTSVRQDFNNDNNNKNQQPKEREGSVVAPLDSFLRAPRPLTMGPRLLRHLGWREGAGAAFVPTTTTTPQDMGTNDDLSQIHLSKRKLRQIKLQSSRVKILPPKLDRCGLGFEALDRAPEFQRYRQQRQEVARARARGQSNVYRVSDVTAAAAAAASGGGDNGSERPFSRAPEPEGGEYMGYETAEDFVGNRSSSGFALRDDDDDAYDPTALGGDRILTKVSGKHRLLGQDYNSEIMELDEDSDIDGDGPSPSKTPGKSLAQASKHVAGVLGGALASWALKNESMNSTTRDDPTSMSGSLTSSGRPPLPGFRLGGSMESHKKRYPGPDLPRDFEMKRHVFGPNERPAILLTIGRGMQLEGEQRAREVRQTEQQKTNQVQRSEQPLMGGNQFATLAAAMKSRFTSATDKSTPDAGETPVAGLHQPSRIEKKSEVELPSKDMTRASGAITKAIAVKRSTLSFMPLPLLCKRFGVPALKHIARPSGVESDGRLTEASYFEKEVLATVRDATVVGLLQGPATNLKPPDLAIEDVVEEPMAHVPRPSKEELKAIFAPDSDGASSSSADTDLDSLDGGSSLAQKTHQVVKKKSNEEGAIIQYDAQNLVASAKSSHDSKREDADDGYTTSSSSSRESRHTRSHKKHKKHRKRKHSRRSSRLDDEHSDDKLEGGEKERKRRDRDQRRSSKKRRKK